MLAWMRRRRPSRHKELEADAANAEGSISRKSAPLYKYATANHSRFADSWILANRTARPNLRALTVAFDRADPRRMPGDQSG